MAPSFLVVYDYGQGGVWAFVNAGSRADITRRLPDFEIVDEPRSWMTPELLDEIKKNMSFDLDSPSGWLADVLKGRTSRAGDIASG